MHIYSNYLHVVLVIRFEHELKKEYFFPIVKATISSLFPREPITILDFLLPFFFPFWWKKRGREGQSALVIISGHYQKGFKSVIKCLGWSSATLHHLWSRCPRLVILPLQSNQNVSNKEISLCKVCRRATYLELFRDLLTI